MDERNNERMTFGQRALRALWRLDLAGGSGDIVYALKDIRVIDFECKTVPLSRHLMARPRLVFVSQIGHNTDLMRLYLQCPVSGPKVAVLVSLLTVRNVRESTTISKRSA